MCGSHRRHSDPLLSISPTPPYSCSSPASGQALLNIQPWRYAHDLTTAADQRDLNAGQCTPRGQALREPNRAFRHRHDRDLATALRRGRHQHAYRLAKPFVEPRYLSGMAGVDDATLALGRDDLASTFRHHIAETRTGIDRNSLALRVPVNAAISRAAKARRLREPTARKPTCEVELLAMLAVRMDAHVASAFRAQQMHGVGDHHRTFVQVVLMRVIRLADAVWRRRQCRDKILEIQARLPISAV